jgi:uncharacterized protein
MTYSIYESTIPPMIRMLQNLSKILDKAVAEAAEKHIDLATLLDARLAPDMFAFPRQIQIASDSAKGLAARLQGAEPPSFPDIETSFPELQVRIAKTIAYLKSVDPAKCAGAEDRTFMVKRHGGQLEEYTGRDFALNRALPNFYFHVVTAYGLLRHNGIDVGKRDYLGVA